jgi:formate dehydrogenase maturation protein FdhE
MSGTNIVKSDAYVNEGGMRCPVCGSEEIEGGFVTTGGGEASQGMRCLRCDTRWTDIYRLDHVLMN